MSRESVVLFLEAVARDPDLQKEVSALAAKHGYAFSADELNDSDLAGIAGGVTDPDLLTVLAKKPGKK